MFSFVLLQLLLKQIHKQKVKQVFDILSIVAKFVHLAM